MDLDSLYRERFDERAERRKDANWREICAYLQRYVPINGSVLDVGCDRGYFIRHIQARERWATDMRDMRAALPSEITFVQAQGERLELGRTFDRIFMSNLLEHLPGSDAVIALLARCSELLAANGQVIVLQPNIRLIGASYWDFIDHRVALTERSLAEAAQQAGLRTLKIITRFLPYTTKSRIPTHPLLVRAYLAFPPAWRLLGKQTLYIAGRA
ncbi:MAG: class I SAM-dependent methyltransferase [Chloroflexi bacterium]|nr:MAG: class I SAM-dependent methyltransferase [Chloroflexota bacterium]TMB95024.1 MAG: class I SAM-dependent methyltransferase [Chloroflexota bacterium]TMC29449.1 MAG: class I SAM-dependent methyltransferase [Chloroflexota bacterium]TMC34175.1 MAG: class I SAM-dependent methyltransferase [Chloroflexota bacterium]TMC58863.1 MAG: class I SAM-dependent methyltransferase [Chloroflexota bacterium]